MPGHPLGLCLTFGASRLLGQQVWQHLVDQIPHNPTFAIIDSFLLPACQFACAYRCRRFHSEAAFSEDTLVRQTFYGLRVHIRLEWPGVITRFCVAPANCHDSTAVPALAKRTSPWLRTPEQRLRPHA
jgi:hypothetical protein